MNKAVLPWPSATTLLNQLVGVPQTPLPSRTHVPLPTAAITVPLTLMLTGVALPLVNTTLPEGEPSPVVAAIRT